MAVNLRVADTSVVQQVDSVTVRSRANGSTVATLTMGAITAQVAMVVSQRVASVKLSASRGTFDALGDTIQFNTAVSDSLGVAVAGQAVAYSAGDTSVVTVGPTGIVTSKRNGSAWIHGTASSGAADSIRVLVAPQVTRVVVKRDSIVLNALQAVLPMQATAVHRVRQQLKASPL